MKPTRPLDLINLPKHLYLGFSSNITAMQCDPFDRDMKKWLLLIGRGVGICHASVLSGMKTHRAVLEHTRKP